MSEFEATRAQAVPQPPQPPGFVADGDLFPTRNGRYRQVGDAKPGGMGLVYRAFDQELEIEVAIKRILPERLGDDASRQRFRLEARAQAQLRRIDGIVGFLDYVEDQYGPYLIMDWIEGQSLAELLEGGKNLLGWRRAAELCVQVCQALQQAHEKGFVHRDVKPGNLLLDESGKVWVCDFGLVRSPASGGPKSAYSPTVTGAMLGTQQFMAPEQEQDPRLATLQSDIFSLGATLHYLVTGRRPGLSRKGIPSELVEVIERATENEPDDRFVSMSEFRAVLELALGVDPPVPQPQVSKPPVPKPPVPRSAKAKSAAAVLAGPESPASAGIRLKPRPLVAPFDADTAKAAQIAWSGFLGQSEEWTNSLGMQLRMIPPGTFQMGSPNGHGDSDEHPQHEVTLTKPFWLGIHEVTQGQWQQLMGTAPWKGKGNVKEGASVAATHISWNDAVQFCLRLSKQESRTYRLPTEAEWEYACRAGTTSKWSFGDSDHQSFDYAWTFGNTVGWTILGGSAQEVGRKLPNPFGLYDMHGNVWEWCRDRFDAGFYQRSPKQDPCNTAGGSVVCRSGSWHDDATGARSANRDFNSPDSPSFLVGFRIVAE